MVPCTSHPLHDSGLLDHYLQVHPHQRKVSTHSCAQCLTTEHSRQYDDIVSNPALAQLSPIPSPYNGLVFGSFNARNDGVSILRSVSSPVSTDLSNRFISTEPATMLAWNSDTDSQSIKKTASSVPLNNMLAGHPANITSEYSGSPVTPFDLVSTYAGCAVTTRASVGVPQACTIQFKAIKTDGTTVSVLCTYTGTVTDSKLQFCDFKGQLNGITVVTIMPTDSATLPQTTVEFLDNTQVTEYIKS